MQPSFLPRRWYDTLSPDEIDWWREHVANEHPFGTGVRSDPYCHVRGFFGPLK